jgi:hypothetical protein
MRSQRLARERRQRNFWYFWGMERGEMWLIVRILRPWKTGVTCTHRGGTFSERRPPVDAAKVEQIEATIADLEARGGPTWTNHMVYLRTGGSYAQLAAYLKARRAAPPAPRATAATFLTQKEKV